MTLEEYINYCQDKPGVTIESPMGPGSIWIKVMGKMFSLTNTDDLKMGKEIVPPFHFINLKCDPERAIELREQHPSIRGGWHQSKVHWNSVYMDGTVNDNLVYELIDHAYDIVVQSLPKKLQEELKNL